LIKISYFVGFVGPLAGHILPEGRVFETPWLGYVTITAEVFCQQLGIILSYISMATKHKASAMKFGTLHCFENANNLNLKL
jgi:hypothetical protein